MGMLQSTTLFPRQPILHRVLFLSLSSGSLPLALGRPTLFSFFGKAPASSSSSPPLPAAFVFRCHPPQTTTSPPSPAAASVFGVLGPGAERKEKWAAISVSPFLKGRRVGWAVNFLRPFYPSSSPFSSSCSFFPLPFPLYLRVAPPSPPPLPPFLRSGEIKQRRELGTTTSPKVAPASLRSVSGFQRKL